MTSRHLIAFAAAVAGASVLFLGPLELSAQQSDGDRPGMDESASMQHRLTPEDRQAFLDARIAAVHAGLKLSPDQEKLWPAAESAIRGAIAEMREARQKMQEAPGATDKGDPIARMRRIAERSALIAQNLGKIADATQPLYAALTDDQKWRLHALLRAIHMHYGSEMGMTPPGGESGWRPGAGEWRQQRGGEWRRRRDGGQDEEDMPPHEQSEGD
jgi:LTXXQ motif family protein